MYQLGIRKEFFFSVMALVGLMILASTACGSKVRGTYSDANGAFILELRSGGDASFTFAGETQACTYKVDGNRIALDCKGDKTILTIHDDGSLTGPPGTLMPALRKSKS
jgi:hypothetical protein